MFHSRLHSPLSPLHSPLHSTLSPLHSISHYSINASESSSHNSRNNYHDGASPYVLIARLSVSQIKSWVALSSLVVRPSVRPSVPHRWHLHLSPLSDVLDHTNHIFSVMIWSWQHVSVIISSYDSIWVSHSCMLSCFITLPSFLHLCCDRMRPQLESGLAGGQWPHHSN